MNKTISFVLCTALAACASPNSEVSGPEVSAPEGTSTISVDKPEVRYYVISET